MTRPPHMNGNKGGKDPMDQRRLAGYGSGISGVSRKPPQTSLGNSATSPPSMQQGLHNESKPSPPPPQLSIGDMPSKPRFSNDFGSVRNSPAYNTMAPAPMQMTQFGETNQKPTMVNRIQNGWSKSRKIRPFLMFTTIAGVTYLGLRTMTGGRSASRMSPDDDDDVAIDDGESYR